MRLNISARLVVQTISRFAKGSLKRIRAARFSYAELRFQAA